MRTKIYVVLTVLGAIAAMGWTLTLGVGAWLLFPVFLAAIILSSGLKVALHGGEGGMSLSFPFLLLAVVQLSAAQAMLLAALSVAFQYRLKAQTRPQRVQIAFNMASTLCAIAAASACYLALGRRHMALTPALAIAAAAYFLVSTGTVALVVASASNQPAFGVWRRQFPWYLPFYFVGAVLAAMTELFSGRYGWMTSLLLLPVVYTIYRAYDLRHVRLEERAQHLQETQDLHYRTIEGLSMAIEAKDQNTHEHLFRVRRYVEEVGAGMKLPEPVMEALRTASFLHDIGKLAVPEHILNKPGKLSPAEFEKMKIHPVVGADILERVRFPYPVVPIVRSHHEWWNGSGYPDGLKGEAIPIGARVLSAVDCFDALVSDRPYRKGIPIAEALALVRSMSGIQFDPQVVSAIDALYANMGNNDLVQADRFTPLNVDFAVWRGEAPGAGYEESRGARPQAPQPFSLDAAFREGLEEQQSLSLIAAARQQAQTLYDLNQGARGPSHTASLSLSLEETLQLLSHRLRTLIPFDGCALYVTSGDTLRLRYVDGVSAGAFGSEPTALGEGISGWVAQSGKPILNGNAGMERSYHPQRNAEPELLSALSIPLHNLQQEVFGVLTLYSVSADFFERIHLRMLEAMSSRLALSLLPALNLSEAADLGSLRQEPTLDPLTSLSDGSSFFLELSRQLVLCARASTNLSVVVCDLNGLAHIHEQSGPAARDRVLCLVAEALRQSCKPNEAVARLGGSELALLLCAAEGPALDERLDQMAAAVQAASRCAGLGFAVTAGMGAAHFPADSSTAEGLLAMAERRLHRQQLATQQPAQQHYTVIAFEEQPEHQPTAVQ